MNRFIKHHLFQYIIILLLFGATVTALASPIGLLEKLTFIGISLSVYFFWGVWHHWEDHKLTAKTVLEYLLLVAILLWVFLNLAV